MLRDLFDSTVLVELHGLVESYVLGNSGNQEDVKEIIQQASDIFFTKDEREDIKLETKFSHYLFGICKNIWLDELKRRRDLILTDSFDDIKEIISEDQCTREKKEALYSILRRNISKLSKKSQKAIEMRLEGLSCKDIADNLNLKHEGIVSNKIRLSRKRLRTLVQQDPEYIQLFSSD